jgi:hypothetical protein
MQVLRMLGVDGRQEVVAVAAGELYVYASLEIIFGMHLLFLLSVVIQ